MKDANKASKKWCSLHKTHLHDNSEFRSQQQQLNVNSRNNRNNRNGQRNGQHQAITTTLAHANTAIKFRFYNSGGKLQQCCSFNTRNYNGNFKLHRRKLQLQLYMHPLHKASGIPSSLLLPLTTSNANFTMTADSGALSHFINNRLLPGIEKRMLNYVHLEPPVVINVAEGHRRSGVGRGILIVEVEDQQGIKRPVQLPVTITPGLGRHLFLGGTEEINGVSIVIAARSYWTWGISRSTYVQTITVLRGHTWIRPFHHQASRRDQHFQQSQDL